MGRFFAWDDPRLEATIGAHLGRIVEVIRSRMEPMAVILRGSFGRGEGSIADPGDGPRFLSDYEIDVATFSPRYRSLFRSLSGRLTEELGVPTSMRWVRPDYLERHRIGPILLGPAPVTICLYESRYGSRVLYGRDMIGSSPAVDPALIPAEDGLNLLFNRMAESLLYMGPPGPAGDDEILTDFWINKMILACAEVLLTLWKSYHYSFEERGRRFASLAPGRLEFMSDGGKRLTELVVLATEFKLRPRKDLYPAAPGETWAVVTSVVEPVFRHVAGEVLGVRSGRLEELAEDYLGRVSNRVRRLPVPQVLSLKLLDVYRSLRARKPPKRLFRPHFAAHAVYAVVPLIFLSYRRPDAAAALAEVRRRLRRFGETAPPLTYLEAEWNDLRRRVARTWKIYCVG